MARRPGPFFWPIMNCAAASDRSLLISFVPEVSLAVHRQVFRLFRLLQDLALPGVYNLHPSYASVLVDFDPLAISHVALEARIREAWAVAEQAPLPPPRAVRIPVVYGGESGPDLEEVARLAGLSPERVIELHSSAEYTVYFLGFSPGFPYLGGLPPELATPRLNSPRIRVPGGSVAIGGSQTGIYPLDSPGGWRIIGRTSLHLFDSQREPAALLQMGDLLRFEPVS